MADGGWVIFDDYLWPYGDGPKKVGDDFVDANQSKIASAFTMGGGAFYSNNFVSHSVQSFRTGIYCINFISYFPNCFFGALYEQ